MLAAIGSTPWKIVLLLHILSVVVAFAPAFTWPIARVQARRRGEDLPANLSAQVAVNDATIHGPAVIAAGAFGILLIVLSDEVYEFSQAWISVAFLLWFAMLGVVYALLVPAGRKAAAGDDASVRRLPMYTGFLHLLLVAMLVVMIWKPGL